MCRAWLLRERLQRGRQSSMYGCVSQLCGAAWPRDARSKAGAKQGLRKLGSTTPQLSRCVFDRASPHAPRDHKLDVHSFEPIAVCGELAVAPL